MAEETPVVVQKFTGLNIREPAASIDDSELSECVNFNIGRAGEVEKRTGFTKLYSGSGAGDAVNLGLRQVTLIGYYKTTAHSQLLAVNSDGWLYYSSGGSAWTRIGQYSVEHGVQYADKFYMVRSNGVLLEWNGTALTVIAGSPSGTFCVVSRDRLFVLNAKASGTINSRLYFSNPGDFSSAGWPSTNFIDINQGDGDFLVGAALLQDLLLLFKGYSVWALYIQGTTSDWVLRNVNPDIGCQSKWTFQEIEGFLYFTSPRGVYRTDGVTFDSLSNDIEPLFRGRSVTTSTVDKDSGVWYEEKYICFLDLGSGEANKRYFVYNLKTEGWSEWDPAPNTKPAFFIFVKGDSPTKGVYCGTWDANGQVYRYGDSVYTDDGANYVCKFATKDFDMGQPILLKRGKWLGIDLENAGSINWTHVADGIAVPIQTNIVTDQAYWNDPNITWNSPSFTWGGTSIVRRNLYRLAGPGFFRSWQLKMEVSHPSRVVFYSATLMMHAKRKVSRAVH